MRRYRAAWVLPIDAPPIPHGVVAVDRGAIVSVGASAGEAADDLGDVAILPGLVNAHTHLELSWMRGRVPPAGDMPSWAASLIALRRAVPAEPSDPIVHAIAEARASGTCLVGDVTNTLAPFDPLADSDLAAVLFREVLGFKANPGDVLAAAAAQIRALTPRARLRPTIAPHAPYSVSPALLAAIAERNADAPLSIHLGESAAEIEFLRDGRGPWRELLMSLGAWDPSWTPPGCGPVEYVERLGLLRPYLLAVHGVHFTDGDLSRLATARATVVTCPRSNRWTGAGAPPIERFYRSGVRVAIGTDSLASVDDLNMFREMAFVRRLAPGVAARDILRSATLSGADALGFAAELGTLTAGKRAELLAVRLSPGLADVEEYLVSSVAAGDIQWLDPDRARTPNAVDR